MSYKGFMLFTGETDKFRGRRYRCPLCHILYWTAWGWARRHSEKEKKKLAENRKLDA